MSANERNEDAYALLIGVGDYRAFEPDGTADLKGPRRDVIGWLHIVRALGVPAQNIRICWDPQPGPAMMAEIAAALGKGVIQSGATRLDVLDGARWLRDQLDGEQGLKGLLTYSGHGTRTAEGQVICPSDVRAAGDGTLDNAIEVSVLADILNDRAAETVLMGFMDTCHDSGAIAGPARSRALPWAGAVPATLTSAHPTGSTPGGETRHLGNNVIASSAKGTPSYEMPVLGGWRGAFSWSVCNLIERWGLADAAKGSTSRMTYRTLLDACRQTLTAFQVPQTPVFYGDGADFRVFSTFGDDAVGDLQPQSLPPLEIWPTVPDGKIYTATIYDTSDKSLGTLYLTGDKMSGSWQDKGQYWDFTGGSWPTETFKVEGPTEASNPSVPSASLNFKESDLSTSGAGTVTVAAGSYGISDKQDSDAAGYLEPGSSLTVYSLQSSPGATLSSSYIDLWFTYESSALTNITVTASATDAAF